MLACVTSFVRFSTCAHNPVHLNICEIEVIERVTPGWRRLVWYQLMTHVWRLEGTQHLPLMICTSVLPIIVIAVSLAFDWMRPCSFSSQSCSSLILFIESEKSRLSARSSLFTAYTSCTSMSGIVSHTWSLLRPSAPVLDIPAVFKFWLVDLVQGA